MPAAAEDIVTVLFALLRRDEDPGLQNLLDRLSAADWEELSRTSLRLGVAPLLYDRIKRMSPMIRVPVDTLDALKLAYHNNAAQNLIVRRQLEEMLSILEAHQIPVILLKGGALAFTVYDNPACRMMSDLDIMVHETDLQKAVSSLQQAGYRMSKPAWERPGHHLPALVMPGPFLPVEVHWQLTSPGRAQSVSPQETWQHVHSLSLFGHPLLTLSPGLTLFHICQHTAYQHLFANGAQGMCDIESIVFSYGETLDWEMLGAFAEKTRCTRGTLLSLKLSDRLLAVSLPAEIQGSIAAEDIPATMVLAATDRLFMSRELPDSPPGRFVPMLKWWLEKGQKLLLLVRETGTHRAGGGEGGGRQSFFGLRRLFFLLVGYWEAAVRHVRNDESGGEAKNNRILRTWLGIR